MPERRVPVSTPNHPIASDVLQKFLLIHRHLRQIARQFDSQGMRPRQFAVLRFLLEQGSATVSQVQDHLYTSVSTASTLISQLEESGYVTRVRSKEDNRVVIVELTPEGQKLVEQTPLSGIALMRRRLDSLPEERLQQLDDSLAVLMELMEVTNGE
jgi:DNA-binding MarR family transcriptional regulator